MPGVHVGGVPSVTDAALEASYLLRAADEEGEQGRVLVPRPSDQLLVHPDAVEQRRCRKRD